MAPSSPRRPLGDTHLCCLICCMENLLAGSYSSIPDGETMGGSALGPSPACPCPAVLGLEPCGHGTCSPRTLSCWDTKSHPGTTATCGKLQNHGQYGWEDKQGETAFHRRPKQAGQDQPHPTGLDLLSTRSKGRKYGAAHCQCPASDPWYPDRTPRPETVVFT